MSPAMAGGFLTTAPPGKPKGLCSLQRKNTSPSVFSYKLGKTNFFCYYQIQDCKSIIFFQKKILSKTTNSLY